jgi:hypothetical protein
MNDMSIDVAEPGLYSGLDPASTGLVVLDVVVPVFNEESDLEPSVRRLDAHLAAHFPYSYRITTPTPGSTSSPPPWRTCAGCSSASRHGWSATRRSTT